MHDGNWQSEGDNQLSTTLHNLHLTVRRFDRCARYIIRERQHHDAIGPALMLASGTADDLDAAIAAARRTALRVRLVLAERDQDHGYEN